VRTDPVALLIGGRGFIGSWLTPTLIERSFRVVYVEPTATSLGCPTPWADHVELVNGSAANPDDIDAIITNTSPDVIVNLAFARDMSIAAELDVMARGTWNILDAAAASGAPSGSGQFGPGLRAPTGSRPDDTTERRLTV
jgi:nucleoside-diphosphate-sugar epimerase